MDALAKPNFFPSERIHSFVVTGCGAPLALPSRNQFRPLVASPNVGYHRLSGHSMTLSRPARLCEIPFSVDVSGYFRTMPKEGSPLLRTGKPLLHLRLGSDVHQRRHTPAADAIKSRTASKLRCSVQRTNLQGNLAAREVSYRPGPYEQDT